MHLSQHVLLSTIPSLLARAAGPSPGQIKNLVTFGDSYTDVDGHADGGVMWPVFAAEEGGFTLHNFAKEGAMCSNNLTQGPVPSLSVFETQLPSYFSQKSNGTLDLDPEETIYTLWIGTNDVGVIGLLRGFKAPGVTVVDTVACAVNWIKVLYASGARNFIFQNMIPLDFVPGYAYDSYWNRDRTSRENATATTLFMEELTTAGNEIARLMLQALAPTLDGAHIALFDSHSLFADMIRHPELYLNGTAPLNVTGAVHACYSGNYDNCTDVLGTDQDSYLWYDELHPSVQAERVVAKAMSDVIARKAENWTTWFS
ncbi:SGNH hydrolase-type esterase domain-containing protein [Daedaleopsis nitida]|nr:SGNH hydrolase-type esterase domain-containing protein [Daedaleopsis nitida]